MNIEITTWELIISYIGNHAIEPIFIFCGMNMMLLFIILNLMNTNILSNLIVYPNMIALYNKLTGLILPFFVINLISLGMIHNTVNGDNVNTSILVFIEFLNVIVYIIAHLKYDMISHDIVKNK